tara:strand:- start:82 stop:303 length:222 start_codon:yes stop_codon:yes gene_type:complete
MPTSREDLEKDIMKMANLTRENERLRLQVQELKQKFRKYGEIGLKAMQDIDTLLTTEEPSHTKTSTKTSTYNS